MAKADIETTTNQDASLFRKVNQVAEYWRQSVALDEQSRDARRLENHSKAKELAARQRQAADKAGAMEWEIILMNEASTPAGHAAKCGMVAASGFDPEDLVTIAWHLGREAGKLGLSGVMPQLAPPEVPPMAAAG
jgi:hypothetical protein